MAHIRHRCGNDDKRAAEMWNEFAARQAATMQIENRMETLRDDLALLRRDCPHPEPLNCGKCIVCGAKP